MKRAQVICLTALVVVALATPAAAQFDPILRLQFETLPECPFDCDSVYFVLSGELSSTAWMSPEVTSLTRTGNHFDIEYTVTYDPNNTLPVTQPFQVSTAVGPLAEGEYDVTYVLLLDNPIATMPIIPQITGHDKFRVAPAGDQDCNGLLNIIDVVKLIRPIFSDQALTAHAVRRADVDCNGHLDIFDLVTLLYHVFKNGPICDPCGGTPPAPYVHIVPGLPNAIPGDNYELQSVGVAGDILSVTLAHSGGCMDHEFDFIVSADLMESNPVQTMGFLRHTDPGDPCDAWVTTTQSFNLRPLADLYRLLYGQYDPIVINVLSYDGSLYTQVTYTPQ